MLHHRNTSKNLAKDLIRREKLIEVLLTYADTIEQMDVLRTRATTASIEQLSLMLHTGLTTDIWPWTPDTEINKDIK